MDSLVNIFKDRAQNELRLASAMFLLSGKEEIKEALGVLRDDTFYSAVISHSYYSIFYAAKAVLLIQGIRTTSPEVHNKTFEAFKRVYVDTGKLDMELLRIYQKMIVRADELLNIFKKEKRKRGHFTYETIPQANIEPADDSLQNAKKFLKHLLAYIDK